MPGPILPLRHLVATALLGDQESIESVLLTDVFSSGGSRNLSIDKSGNVLQILGYTKRNAAAIVSQTGAAAMRLRSLYHFVTQAAGVATRQEIGIFDDGAAHWEFRTSPDAGVTWNFVNDYGAGSVNAIPDFAGSGNLLFMTNGVIPPAQWDGTTLTVAGSVQLAAPTFTSTGAGTLVGNISWRILPMVGNVRKNSSVQSVSYAINAATGLGHVDWIADPDVTVTGYEIYRTTGTGSIFYNEGSVVGRNTVTFAVGGTTDTDTTIIANRVMQEFGDSPPVGAYFAVPHLLRIFYLRTNANPRTAFYSDPGLAFSCNLSFNKIDFTDAESFTDVSTGGTGDFLGTLVVWEERSVWVLAGDGTIVGTQTNFNLRRTNAQMGSVSHRTVVRIPAGASYTDSDGNTKKTSSVTLAYLSPLADVRIFDGDNDEIISFPKRLTLQRANYAQRSKSFAVHDHQRQEVTWIYAADAAGEPSIGVTWNYRWGTWYERDWPFACGIEIETPNTASLLIAGEGSLLIGGFCYQLWNGFTFNGAAINSQWMTKTLYGQGFFGDPTGLYGKPLISHRKRWRFADSIFNVLGGGNVSLTVDWVAGDDPLDTAPALGSRMVVLPLSILETADGKIIETADGQEIAVQSLPSTVRAKLQDAKGKYAHSRGLRLRYRLTTNSAQWALTAIDTAYQLLPGQKRTIQNIQ